MFYPQTQQNPAAKGWIVGVVIAIVSFVILLGIYYARSRRLRQVIRTQYRNPSRIESGFNRDCTNIIQQSHIYRCNGIMIQ